MLSLKTKTILGLSLTAGISLSALLGYIVFDWLAEKERISAQHYANSLSNQISEKVNERVTLTKALSAFAKMNLSDSTDKTDNTVINRKEFERFAQSLQESTEGVLSLQLAPQAVVTYLTDPERNQKAIGHDLLVDDNRREQVLQSIESRSAIFAGPLELLQGGTAIIIRFAVFDPNANFNAETYRSDRNLPSNTSWINRIPTDFWGMATVLIDSEAMLNAINFENDKFHIAIRGRHGLGEKGEVFYGDPQLFDEPLLTKTIPFEGGSWVVGLRALNPQSTVPLLAILLLGSAMSGLIAFYIVRLEREKNDTIKAKRKLDSLASRLEETVEERTQQLVEKRKQQEDLFAIIGHELRTPASSLHMLIARGIQQGDIGTSGEQLKKTSEHLLSVLDDMGVVTNPDRAIQGKLAVTSVNTILSDLIATQDRLFLQNNLHVRIEKRGEADVNYECNEQLIRQIVLNLLKNSALHSNASELSILLESQRVDDEYLNIKLTFTDDGNGIAEEFRDKLFEPFVRGASEADGSGLGLYLCRKFAREHLNGDLCLDPNYEQGARFILTMQLSTGQTEDKYIAEQPLLVESIKGVRILFAEDNTLIQMLTAETLEEAGAVVFIASDGKEALEIHDKQQIDLVLTDAFMPEINGFELSRTLRGLGFDKAIIGLTAATVGEEKERLKEAGMDAVMSKPFSLETFPKLLFTLGFRNNDLSAEAQPSDPKELAEKTDPQLFNETELLSSFNPDPKIASEKILKLTSRFKTQLVSSVGQMRADNQKRDAPAVRTTAHTLKGSILLFHSDSLTEICQSIINAAEDADFDRIKHDVATLESMGTRLLQALETQFSTYANDSIG